MTLEIDVYPIDLVEGDNDVTITVYNYSQNPFDEVIISFSSEDLFIISAPGIRFPTLEPGESLTSVVKVATLSDGSATLGLRCSWKQQQKAYYNDTSFEFNVSQESGDKAASAQQPGSAPAYLRDYYLNAIPKWQKLLLKKHKHLSYLQEQAALWGDTPPVHVVHQIEGLTDEIDEMIQKLNEAEAYLRSE